MNVYTCTRCGYHTDDVSNFKKHIHKKNTCNPIKADVTIESVREQFLQQRKEHLENKQTAKTIFICSTCSKEYKSRQGLYTHTKQCMKNHTLENRIKQMEDMIIDLGHRLSASPSATVPGTTTNNTNNTNTNNTNIVNNVNNFNVLGVRNFGEEDISHLPGEFLSNCLLNPTKGITSLIEYIHYNEDKPCNYNLRFKSWKKNMFEKCMHGEWKECDASNTLDELIRKGYRIMNAHYTENFLNDPEIAQDLHRQHAYECFRFLGDKKCQQYHNVKRDLRLLVKDKTMFVLALGLPEHELLVTD